jgi:hypothetical protein
MVTTLCKGRLEWIKIGGGDTSKYVTETNSQQGLCMQAGDGIVFKSGHTLILLLFFLSILMPCRCCAQASKSGLQQGPSRWYKKSGFLFDEREFLARLQWHIKQIHLAVYWKCISIKHCDTSNTTPYGGTIAIGPLWTHSRGGDFVRLCSHASSRIRPWHLN